MKGQKTSIARSLQFERVRWNVPLPVPMRSYVQFSRWMDRELEHLVARWSHAAAPNVSRMRRKPR